MTKLTIYAPTQSLDEYKRLAELASFLGATHLSASQIEPSMWQWNANRYDPYPNWALHRASLFKYIVPEQLKPYLPEDYAKRNLDTLVKRVEILREFGLKATFEGMEPAYFPEAAYLDHPSWRGPRCDQARRARTEYYAPCTDDPEIREMYISTVEKLCRVAPFESFVLLTNDSGGGLCWANGLYPGVNGPLRCKGGSIGDRIVNFLSLFQEGAARAGITAEADVWHITAPDMAQALPKLKPGQSINNCTFTTKSKRQVIGFEEFTTKCNSPIELIPRVGAIAEQLQNARKDPDADIFINLRGIGEIDAITFLKKYMHTLPKGIAARYQALTDTAASIVGEQYADDLAEIWDLIEKVHARFDHLATGGHIFMLGTVHQRWLTRPFVPFPNELPPEEKDYYRQFLFQAQKESDADNMLDLQAHRWIGGYSGKNIFDKSVALAMPQLNSAINLSQKLWDASSEAPEKTQRYLEHLTLCLKLYRCIIRNAVNAITFQTIIDRTDYSTPPCDTTPNILEQGDPRYLEITNVCRAEIDNTLEIIELLQQAHDPILRITDNPDFESVMMFGPTITEQLKKKIAVMEKHRRDFTRLYMSYNR